jgi:hypothetical protein
MMHIETPTWHGEGFGYVTQAIRTRQHADVFHSSCSEWGQDALQRGPTDSVVDCGTLDMTWKCDFSEAAIFVRVHKERLVLRVPTNGVGVYMTTGVLSRKPGRPISISSFLNSFIACLQSIFSWNRTLWEGSFPASFLGSEGWAPQFRQGQAEQQLKPRSLPFTSL